MMTEEQIAVIEQRKALVTIKGDINRALQGVDMAIHYLHETYFYESDVLDNALDDLMDMKANLEGLISD